MNDMKKTEIHSMNVRKACRYIEENQAKVNERFRLKYHVMPSCGWMNDPNGLIKFKGEYHIFFQYYPYDAKWGPMHWGHAKSKDLIHFEYLPVALAPSEAYDSDSTSGGCFSGSAADDDGLLTLIYTGSSGNNPPQVQCVATSSDGITFNKYEKNPVIPSPPSEGSGDFRDPKVWKHGGKWYLVVGSGKDGIGKAFLYTSQDLRSWKYEGVLAQGDMFAGAGGNKAGGKDGSSLGFMWECPDMFHLNGADVLMTSPIGMKDHKNIFMIGKMDYDTNKFRIDDIQEVDMGPEFYAAQTFDDGGRRCIIGWMRPLQGSKPTDVDGWAGALTMPRYLTMDENGRILTKPFSGITKIRDQHERFEFDTSRNLNDILSKINSLKGITFEINLSIETKKPEGDMSLMLRCSDDLTQYTKVKYDAVKGEISFDRNKSGIGDKDIYTYEAAGGKVDINIFLDTSSAEMFLNGGQASMTFRIYPDKTSDGIKAVVNMPDAHVTLDIWMLKI